MIRLPSIGEDFGRYRLLRRLGQGGMGVVYAAHDPRLDREVAVKIIAPHLAADDDYRARFAREAQALSRLDSPHVVPVHDHGEQDGCLYLVTQLVGGGDLGARLSRSGPPTPAEALALVDGVLAGLAEAHRAGVVHRDVKPSNVLLRRREGRWEAVLCDFGVATSGTDHVTRTGALVGSAPYLAPERHQGVDSGAAGDLYAVGCLLWRLLTGTVPYGGTELEVALGHLQAPVPQLGGGDPFARRVDEVLRRSLAKRPEDRYASAAQMRHDLETAAAVVPASVDLPDQTQVRQRVLPDPAPWSGRSRWRAAVAAVAAVAVVGAAAGAVVLARGSGPAEGAAEPPAGTTSGTTAAAGPSTTVPRRTTAAAPEGARAERARRGTDVAGVVPDGLLVDDPGGATDRSGTGRRDQDQQDQQGRPGGGPGGQQGQQGGQAGQAGASSSPASPPPPPPTFRCWNGATTHGRDECSRPTGVAGLAWVYPGLRRCVQEAGPAGRVTVLVCDRENGSVRVVEWPSVAAASRHFRSEYGHRGTAWRSRWGYTWAESERRTNLYLEGPYSLTVKGGSRQAKERILAAVDYRPPGRLRGTPL